MGSLYIGGAQCIHAEFTDEDDWEIFDKNKKEMQKIAQQFNVHIDRYSLDEDAPSFVVMNEKANHECFYSGAAFEYDMSVSVSDTFESRALEFIKALNSEEKFSKFHNLTWSTPKVLYFTTS